MIPNHSFSSGFTLDQTGYYQPADGANADYPAVQTPQQTSSGFDWSNQQQQQYGDQQQQQQMGGNYANFGTQVSVAVLYNGLDIVWNVTNNSAFRLNHTERSVGGVTGFVTSILHLLSFPLGSKTCILAIRQRWT